MNASMTALHCVNPLLTMLLEKVFDKIPHGREFRPFVCARGGIRTIDVCFAVGVDWLWEIQWLCNSGIFLFRSLD